MVPGRGPLHDDNSGDRLLAFLGDIGPYWFYVLVTFLLVIGLGLVALLSFFYVRRQSSVVVSATPTSVAVSPHVGVEPASGPPGTLLRVAGEDWPAGDVVFISLEAPFAAAKRDFAYAGAVVGEDGLFHVNFAFPDDTQWANTGAVKIVAWAEQSGTKSVTIFQVEATDPARSIVSMGDSLLTTQSVETSEATSERVSIAGFLPQPTATVPPSLPAANWYGEYFDNATQGGDPVFFRDDRELDFDWGEGSPDETLAPDYFSVRWSRYVPFTAGVYRFFAVADDGVRLWVDDRLVIDQWHQGASTTYVADTYLWDGPHLVRLDYYEDTQQAIVRLWWERLEVYPDWKGEYFNNANLEGQPAQVRNDPQIHFNWGNSSPVQGVHARDFSVRWTQRIAFARGRYRFYVNANTGMRVWLDSNLALDFWQNAGAGLRTTDLSLDEGEYSVRVEYFNRGGNARAEFHWEELIVPPPSAPLPQKSLSPTGTPVAPTRSDQVEQTQLMMKAQSFTGGGRGETPVHEDAAPGTVQTPSATLMTIQKAEPASLLEADVPVGLQSTVSRAELRIEPVAVRLGSRATVMGAGWKPADEVTIALVEPGGDLTQAPPLATALVDDFGEFEEALLLPEDPNWLDCAELIVLAHNADWTTRLVTPLTVLSSASTDTESQP